jgi:hypothetical protein
MGLALEMPMYLRTNHRRWKRNERLTITGSNDSSLNRLLNINLINPWLIKRVLSPRKVMMT